MLTFLNVGLLGVEDALAGYITLLADKLEVEDTLLIQDSRRCEISDFPRSQDWAACS